MSKPRILIIDDEQGFANVLKSFLEMDEGGKALYEIEIVNSLEQAILKLEDENSLPDLILADLRLEKGVEGLAIFDYLNEHNLEIPGIIVTAFGDKKNLLKSIPKRPYYLYEKSQDFAPLKKIIEQILTEVKNKSRNKTPHLATVKSLVKKLPKKQHLDLILNSIENLTLEEYEELEEELPLLRLSIKDAEQEKKEIDKIDLEREQQGLIPLSIIEKAGIYYEKHSYKSKITGKRNVYPYFYLRWVDENGKQDFIYLGSYKKIKDPIILEKIHEQYPEFKRPNLKKYQ